MIPVAVIIHLARSSPGEGRRGFSSSQIQDHSRAVKTTGRLDSRAPNTHYQEQREMNACVLTLTFSTYTQSTASGQGMLPPAIRVGLTHQLKP